MNSSAIERMEPLDAVIEVNKQLHRAQRFVVKMQSRIDRSVEAYVRVNIFGFSPMLSEPERKEISKKATDLIKQCRNGMAPPEYADIAKLVATSDKSRESWDEMRREKELAMEKIARKLPGHEFVKSIKGAGDRGFAQIIGETGNLSNYPTIAKLWKRLGLAPYDGLAMSTWMRETWRPRKLTNDEWIENPFSRERYAIVQQIAANMFKHQGIGKDRSSTGKWEPTGPCGNVYARRRAWTTETHPDWSDGHRHADAQRYIIKTFVRSLWKEWRRSIETVTIKSTHSLIASKRAA